MQPGFVDFPNFTQGFGSASSEAISQAMFILYRINFCSVSKVAPVQFEQELISVAVQKLFWSVPSVNRSPIRYAICNAPF